MPIQPATASDTRRAAASGSPTRKPNPLAAAILLGLAPLPAAQAATIIVTTAGDAGVANTCTLRQAVLSMNNSTLSGQCQNSGGAFGTNDTINFGGGLFVGNSATVTLADQPNNYLSITDNHGLTIDAGAGRIVIIERPANAQNKFRVLDAVLAGGRLTLSGLTVQNGHAFNDRVYDKYWVKGNNAKGGGMFLSHGIFTLDRCTIRNNSVTNNEGGGPTGAGAGVAVVEGALVMNSSVVTGNSALGSTGTGGGIYLQHASLEVSASTISGNMSGGSAALSAGTGLRISNFFLVTNRISIIDSTISGNATPFGLLGQGSAISAYFTSSLSILNSTLACNSADAGIPAVSALGPGVISVISTIFANTTNSRCTTTTSKEFQFDGAGTIEGNHNLVIAASAIDASAPFPADTVIGDPQLGPLQNNGGPTMTHALPVGSIAINGGSNPANLAYDQRGAPFSRGTGRNPDIGAFEYPYAGLCGTAHGRSFTSLSAGTPNLCSAGASLQNGMVFGSGPWSWFCVDNLDSSSNEFCGARVLPSVNVAVTNAGGTPISSAIYGQPVKLKSIVSGSASAPAGTVTFFDATQAPVPLCVDIALANSGGVMSATCDVPPNSLGVGSRLLRSSYSGNGTYGPASSSNASLAVQPATTTTAISSNAPNPSTIDSPYTVVAQITANAPSVATPSGTVTVEDQTDNLSCIYYVGATPAGCAITPTSAGNHALRVSFSGDPNMTTSSTTTTHNVNRANSTTTLTAPASIAFGQSASVGANVTSAIARTPTGSIQINGGSISCNFNLASASSCSLTPTTYGTFSLSAAYSGDAAFNPSSSAASILTVQSHTIGGQVSGLLAGRSLTLYVDTFPGSEALPLSANGIFAFGLIVPYGTTYAVSLVAGPPDETCTISNGSGSMLAADITNIAVTCTDTIFKNGFDP